MDEVKNAVDIHNVFRVALVICSTSFHGVSGHKLYIWLSYPVSSCITAIFSGPAGLRIVMNGRKSDIEKWEDAYLRQSRDAAVGRMFRGLIHNMNGVIQAFSMQIELVEMLFTQVDEQLQPLLAVSDEKLKANAEKLNDLLQQRSRLISLMDNKMAVCRKIMQRTLSLGGISKVSESEESSVNSIVRTEVEFLCADMFFKHKVKKEFNLQDDMPLVCEVTYEIGQAFFLLLENALDAMIGSKKAFLVVETRKLGERAEIILQDSGVGISPQDFEKIYEPFFTTKPNRAGLGLYLARKMIAACGGAITCESRPGCTRFILSFLPN